MVSDKILKEGYSIELISDDILHLKIDGSCEIDLAKAKEIKVLVLELIENKPFKNLVEFNNKPGILSSEAKSFIANDPDFARLKLCDALITKSLAISVLIGLYVKFFKPITTTRSFTDYRDALIWARTF